MMLKRILPTFFGESLENFERAKLDVCMRVSAFTQILTDSGDQLEIMD